MNKVILVGRLTKDPELRYSNTGELPIVKFALAVDRRFKREGQPDADFINCVSFGKTGEFINNYFSKGKKIGVVGRIQVRSWDDNEGKRNYITEVVIEEAHFVESKGSGGGGNGGYTNQRQDVEPQAEDDFVKVDDDDDELPF